jgi:hypothetical protein
MRFINKVAEPRSSMVAWLDNVQMSEQDREIAKAYLRKTEAVFDLLWLAGARIRAAFARGPQSHAGRERVEWPKTGRGPAAIRVGGSGEKDSKCLKP